MQHETRRPTARDAVVGTVDRRRVVVLDRPDLVQGPQPRAFTEVVIHLESGDEVCVLEGAARTIGVEDLPAVFVDAYDEKYDIRLDLTDADFGLYVLAPRVALTWTEADFPTTATRWTF